MCRVLKIQRSGFYAWLAKPMSARAREDERLIGQIRHFYEQSQGSYGSPRILSDLREDGETCGKHRVARLMRQHQIKALRTYKQPRYRAGKPDRLSPNSLERRFTVEKPDVAWVTDITYIRTWEGWLYLAVVVDLYSRAVIGWSMKPTLNRAIVLDALLMAVWRRRPNNRVLIHSDQGSQYGSDDWIRFCREHKLNPSMSRRGNCWDNAVAEAFFSNLKKERIKRRIYPSREEARADVFDYIEIFYNRTRRHSHIGMKSPYDFELASKAGG